MKHKAAIFLSLIAFLLWGCSSQQGSSSTVQKSSYAKAPANIDLELKTFFESEDEVKIYLKVSTDKLLYARRGEGKPSANLLIELKPKSAKDASGDLESKKIRITDTDIEKAPKMLLASTQIEMPEGGIYSLEIITTDVNRGTSDTKIVRIDRRSQNSRENFLAFEDSAQVPLFKDRAKPNTNYSVKVNSNADVDSLTVLYFNRIFQLPPPPFILYDPDPFDYIPDSIFKFELSEEKTIRFKTGESGFYHILTDPSQRDGHSLFISSEEFPEVQKVQNMIDPFRFLVGGKEYKSILEAENQKKQIESFWIDWAGNKDRARKCIKAYYEGVEEANYHFSSHVEGWMSDRGLIYLIYGKPNKVYRTDVSESWIYGEENNPLSITFDFIKVNNPFTKNDYRLNRDETFKPSWYRSVNAWRDGRIY